MSRVYTLKINDSGVIEYLEIDEVLEDINNKLERLEDKLIDIRIAIDHNGPEYHDPIDKNLKF